MWKNMKKENVFVSKWINKCESEKTVLVVVCEPQVSLVLKENKMSLSSSTEPTCHLTPPPFYPPGGGFHGSSRDSPHLCVLVGDLQQKGQVGVVEGVVQGQQGAVDAALAQVVGIFFQAQSLNPTRHSLVGPNHHIWGRHGDTAAVWGWNQRVHAKGPSDEGSVRAPQLDSCPPSDLTSQAGAGGLLEIFLTFNVSRYFKLTWTRHKLFT